MKIDRSRFLLLAMALSANGCTIIDNRGQTDAEPTDDTGGTADVGPEDTGEAETGSEDTGAADTLADDAHDASDASDAPLCTDEGVTVPACEGTTPDGCVLDDAAACTQFPTYFTARTAKLAIDCALMAPSCEGVVPDPLWECGLNALKAACDDTTVDAYCTALASSCPDATELKADCTTYAAGLNGAGRTRLQTLVTDEGGCTTPLRDLLTWL